MSNTNRGHLVFCGGLSGVGKSTAIRQLLLRHSDVYRALDSGIFMDFLGLKPGDYSSLRRLPVAETEQALERLVIQVAVTADSRPGFGLVDAHFLRIVDGLVTVATGPWLTRLSALVVITADPDVVWRRQVEDHVRGGRDRRLYPVDAQAAERRRLLAQYLGQTVDEARRCASVYGLPLLVVNNTYALPESVADDIHRWLRQLPNDA